ncbi:MAG: hypothetical protein IPK67_20620 [Planctomycetes bacterium]|nr:hypothetical protein [Planctomycetota bacterium]
MSSMLQRAREFVVRGAGLGIALCAIGWTACDQAEFSTQNTQKGEELGASSLSGGAPPQTLIQRMTDARQQHAFQGNPPSGTPLRGIRRAPHGGAA